MTDTAKLLTAGGIVLAVAALGHHHRHAHHGDHRHHGRSRHGCGGGHHHHMSVAGREWQGLTEDEARAKLVDRLGDDEAVDTVIDELDTRGFLARS